MLYRKMKSSAFLLLCVALMAGVATKIYAQDNQDNNVQSDAPSSSKKDGGTESSAQIPASLVNMWKKQANQGNADAQFLLGNAYYTGNGVEQDYNEAISWWHKAAAQGNTSAQKALDQLVPK